MRKLILISGVKYYRDFVTADAFSEIDDDETYYLTGGSASVVDPFTGHPRYLGPMEVGMRRDRLYEQIRQLQLAHLRHRSRTAKVKFDALPWRARMLLAARTAPGIRQLTVGRKLRSVGENPAMREMLTQVRPDLVIAPSSGVTPQGNDLIRCARDLGIRSLALMYNWDNLSSKAVFVGDPDFIAVGGIQGAEHATQIHGIPPERVGVLGSPYIDRYFRHPAGSTKSPFPFPYVLFAGCYQPFDERTAIELLDRSITRRGLDLKIVYLPHPSRMRRDVDDFVDDSKLENVIVEPRQRQAYVEGHEEMVRNPKFRKWVMGALPLDYYPSLLENAKFVICPLSTMMLEAAILRRQVLVIGYHDGIHATSPGVARNYLHFEGTDRVDNFRLAREQAELVPFFERMAGEELPARRPPKDQMDYWVYHDERTFGQRLEDFVDRIAGRQARAPAGSERVPA